MLRDLHSPEQLKKMTVPELKQLAKEIRTELVKTVSKNGGHLASNLGIVELTVAMHYVFDCPEDKLVFDVGHQCYVHKLLTGRFGSFSTLRKKDGLSGFPDPEESEYDTFVAGHASTAISAALGMARTRDIMGSAENIVAIVGDGALSGGMCYEALNDAGQSETRMIVILNDNEMSISKNVGAMSRYLNELRQSRSYRGFKRFARRSIERIPKVGSRMFRFVEKIKNVFKGLFIDGKFFEALGFVYIGPIDGHDLKHLIKVLKRAKDDTRPVLIHVITQKGKGYEPAENHPDRFHGVAPFFVESGLSRSSQGEAGTGQIVAQTLSHIAESDIRISVITAAMTSGTGMTEFADKYPNRFFDVGIAEEHAVTMAAGMASAGMKPYVAVYSTFMQRGYDQILNDVCRNSLPVTLLLDRAGFVGADGKTHQGLFDISYLRTMPGLIVAAPRDVRELKKMVELSTSVSTPMAIRYPKCGVDLGARLADESLPEIGKWQILAEGTDVMIFAVGPMVQIAMQSAIELMGKNISAGVTDARFIKPMDEEMIRERANINSLIVTLEDNVLAGGFGEGVDRVLADAGYSGKTLNLGVKDGFVAHGTEQQQREACGLDVAGVCNSIMNAMGEKK